MKHLIIAVFISTAFCFSHLTSNNFNERVYGGLPAPDGDYPYYVFLHVRNGSNDNIYANHSFCGGSIIKYSWILTVSSSTEERSKQEFKNLIFSTREQHISFYT
jgi:secreted trypsin-like serine protease